MDQGDDVIKYYETVAQKITKAQSSISDMEKCLEQIMVLLEKILEAVAYDDEDDDYLEDDEMQDERRTKKSKFI